MSNSKLTDDRAELAKADEPDLLRQFEQRTSRSRRAWGSEFNGLERTPAAVLEARTA
jgi:hypothetical protein